MSRPKETTFDLEAFKVGTKCPKSGYKFAQAWHKMSHAKERLFVAENAGC